MVESFFYGNGSQLDFSPHPPIMLLSGPSSCGKTSLLFQFAFNHVVPLTRASNNSGNRNVVFICNRRRLLSNPPFLSQGIDPASDTFQLIRIKYVDDEEGIKKFFAAFHLHDTFPLAVIIDDFGDFFNQRRCQERYGNLRGRDLAMVRVLALCHNAVMHANFMHSENGNCKVLLSDTHHGETPRQLFIYRRWVSSIFTINGDGRGSYLLRSNSNLGNRNSERMRTAKYSIALQHLILEGFIEDEENKH